MNLPNVEIVRHLDRGRVLIRCSRCSLIMEASEKNLVCRACDKPVKRNQ